MEGWSRKTMETVLQNLFGKGKDLRKKKTWYHKQDPTIIIFNASCQGSKQCAVFTMD